MPNPAQMQDRYGLPLTTSSTRAAERFIEGLDLLLEQNFGPEDQFTQAIEADPGFALAYSALAYMLHLRAQVPEARERVQQAQALAAGLSRREQQQIEAIALFVNGQGPRSYALIREHLAEYPRDILMLRVAQRLFSLGCSGAGVASFPAPLLALMQRRRLGLWGRLGVSGLVCLRAPRNRTRGGGAPSGGALPGVTPDQCRRRPLRRPCVLRDRRRCERWGVSGDLAQGF